MAAAWVYWGYDAGLTKPEVADLNDHELYELTIKSKSEKLPEHALSEVWREWEARRLRVKVYRDTSPRKNR